MFCNIVTNMGHGNKPWESVPIEVLIEWERQKEQERFEQERPRLYAPIPMPIERDEKPEEEEPIIIRI